MNRIEIKRIAKADDLKAVTASISGANWDKANDEKDYDEKAIREFVTNPDNYLLIAYVDGKAAGVALAIKLLKPYKDENWLYVDEVDVMVDYRRKGVASALMKKTFEIAKKLGLDEVWLGTEPDNTAANRLYKSLRPNKIENFVGYTYKMKASQEN